MRPHLETLQRVAPVRISCHPNAGLPNEMGQYDLGPAEMAELVGEFADEGWVNIVGGCCGTSPDHIAAIAARVAGVRPHVPVTVDPLLRLSGTRPLTLRPESNFLMIGERTNVTGSRKFARLIKEENYEEAIEIARGQIEGGANIIDINMDEGLLDSEAVMTKFLRLIAGEIDIAAVPVMIDSSKWSVLEAGLQAVQGKCDRQFDQPERWRGGIPAAGPAVPPVRGGGRGDGFRRARAGRREDNKVRICQRAYELLTEQAGFRPDGHHLRSEYPDRRHRHRRTQQLRGRLYRRHAADQDSLAPACISRAAFRMSRSRSAATTWSARRCIRLPVSRDPRRARHGDRQRRAVGRLRRYRTARSRNWSRTCC